MRWRCGWQRCPEHQSTTSSGAGRPSPRTGGEVCRFRSTSSGRRAIKRRSVWRRGMRAEFVSSLVLAVRGPGHRNRSVRGAAEARGPEGWPPRREPITPLGRPRPALWFGERAAMTVAACSAPARCRRTVPAGGSPPRALAVAIGRSDSVSCDHARAPLALFVGDARRRVVACGDERVRGRGDEQAGRL